MPKDFLSRKGLLSYWPLGLVVLLLGEQAWRGRTGSVTSKQHTQVKAGDEAKVEEYVIVDAEEVGQSTARLPFAQKIQLRPKEAIGGTSVTLEEIRENLAICNDRGATSARRAAADEKLKNYTAVMGEKGHEASILTSNGVTSFQYRLNGSTLLLTVDPPLHGNGKGFFLIEIRKIFYR